MPFQPLFTRRKQSVAVAEDNQSQLMETLLREDWNSFRDRTPANDRFYLAGSIREGGGASSVVPTDNRLHFVPLIVPVRSRLAELGATKTQGATNTPIRIGLYRARSQVDVFPDRLLFASESIDTTVAAFYSELPDLVLEEGLLYWAAFVRQGGSALTFAVITGHTAPIFGYTRPTSTIVAPTVAFGLDTITAALPDTVDPAALVHLNSGNAVPMLLARFVQV